MSSAEIQDLTDGDRADDGKLIISSLNLERLDYKQGSSGSDHRLRFPTVVAKRRLLGQDDYPNFERQYIQNINIPTAAKTEGDNDGAVQNHDDNYHFLMSLLPYLREVPKNRKMVVRHKLQKVFVEEQERKSVGRNTHANGPNFNNFPPTQHHHHMPQTPRHPPPPYPGYKQDFGYSNYVPSATAASMPMQNASASTSAALSDLLIQPISQQFPAPVGLPTGHQQLQTYYNTNNKHFASYGGTVTVASANNNNFSLYGATTSSVANNNNFSNYSSTTSSVTNNNNFSNYSSTTAALNNITATAEVINDSFSNYNAADSSTYTYQSAVTGEPQTITYLQ